MNALFLAVHILFSIGMFLSLKVINSENINKFQAITINYIVAFVLTAISYDRGVGSIASQFTQPIIIASLWVGFLFIFTFILMSYSTIRSGIGITTALNKMSVVIPVLIGVLYLGQRENILIKTIGIILGLLSFVLILYKESNEKFSFRLLLLPLSVFLVSGLLDTSMEVVNKLYVGAGSSHEIFLMGIYITASLLGIITVLYDIKYNKSNFGRFVKPLAWGTIMGIFNFLVSKMILVNVERMGGSIVFPVHNAAVVMFTAFIGVLFFRESFSKKQWQGVILAVISVILIAASI